MKQYRWVVWLWFCLGVSAAADTQTAAANPKLSLGIFPFMSSQFLANWWMPIRQHISATSKLDLDPVFPQTFAEDLELLNEGNTKSALVAIPTHFYAYVVERYHVRPVAIFPYRSTIEVVAKNESQIQQLDDLKGKCIAMPDELSFAAITADNTLHARHWYPERDYTVIHLKTHADVLMSVLHKNCDAGVVTDLIVQQMQPELSSTLHVVQILDYEDIAAVLVAKPEVPQATLNTIATAMSSFGKTPGTKEYLKQPLYKELRKPTAQDIQQMTNFSAPFKKIVARYNVK